MAGTTWDLVVLSSSPLAAEAHGATSPPNVYPRRRVAMPAPRPLAVSPPASPNIRADGASRPRPRAAPIPEGVVRGFATVGKLVQSEYFARQPEEHSNTQQQGQSRRGSIECMGEAAPATIKPRKRVAKAKAADGSEQPKPKPRPRARKSKPDPDNAPHDPELRLPVPTESPFFPHDSAQTPIEPRDGSETTAAILTKTGRPRKARARKQKPEHNDKAPDVESKSKVHKIAQRKRVARDGRPQRDATPTVSAHFRGDTEAFGTIDNRSAAGHTIGYQDMENEDTAIWEILESPRRSRHAALKRRPPDMPAEGLDLEEAVARRRDWTPPPEDTTTQTPSTESVGKENKRLVSDGNGNFTHLVSNFAYTRPPPAQASVIPGNLAGEAIVVTKRRRVELVEVPNQQNHSRNSSPDKSRGPKKKTRTITDLVTEQYAPKIQEPILDHVTSDLFQMATATKAPLKAASNVNSEVLLKAPSHKRATPKSGLDRATSKSKSKSKSKKACAKSAKSKPTAEKLLSPTSALLQMSRQAVLFGTSSQLALEESPTTIRQLRLALKTSEEDAGAPNHDHTASALPWPRLGKITGTKGLWAASARDDNGGILEHTNVVYLPVPDRTQDFPLLMDGTHDEIREPAMFKNIDDTKCSPPILISSDLLIPSRTASPGIPVINLGENKSYVESIMFDDIGNFEQEPPPSNQNADSRRQFVDIDDFVSSPALQVDTNPPLESKWSASGTLVGPGDKDFEMPSKCDSVPGMSDSIASAVAAKTPKAEIKMDVTRASLTPPNPTLRFLDIEEILDSEEEALEALSPTPPHNRRLQDSPSLSLVSLGPIPLKATSQPASKSSRHSDLLPILRVPSSYLRWMHIKDQVCEQMTAHIRSLPPSIDPKSPSWHEKILMYDPIVLEDFTTYLNANTSIRTYKKATQKQIKAWNQMLKRNKQAMLLVSENEDEVLVVEKELEAHMVQCWCESLSICCIWGEGRGKGGARKGLY